ncbi:hypothetical protein, partial [Sansalvadorimonas verongulae]|uniref:hypothetical protein n=1 Tax=Sansalvadorimonas verongulae TaxID=2172824 RepID=UPI001E51270D
MSSSRFPHFNAWVRKHYRELQVRTDDDRPADVYGMYTLKVHTRDKPFACDQEDCNKSFTTSSDL